VCRQPSEMPLVPVCFVHVCEHKRTEGVKTSSHFHTHTRFFFELRREATRHALGHSAKLSFYSGILYAKFFDCGVSLNRSLIRPHTVYEFCHEDCYILYKRTDVADLAVRGSTIACSNTNKSIGSSSISYGRFPIVMLALAKSA
jgi:hypothetical protein